MKTILYVIAAFLLVGRAGADPIRYQWRAFGGVNVELQPLFSWWSFVSRATNQPMDITAMDPDKFRVISNIWAHLPARPMPEWTRIIGQEGSMTIVGSRWRMDATIEPAPMLLKHETIYIENPPTREIHDFKVARAASLSLQAAQNSDVAGEQSARSNIQAEASTLLQTNVPANPDAAAMAVNPGFVNGNTRTFEHDSAAAISDLNSAHARTIARDSQLAPLEQYLATFPDKNVYWLDHFAVRTGRKVDGLDVYDLGAAAGLTY